MKLEQAAFPSPGGLRLVQRLPANDGGRDFVVGDLHGCRAELERLLRLVDFDPTGTACSRSATWWIGDRIPSAA